MGFLNITIVIPNPNGTPIFDVSSGVDKKKQIGLSLDWSTRLRASANKGGCPSWIDQIVVAKDLATAKSTRVRAVQAVGIASSSFSSRDVVAIFLDKDGNEDKRGIYPFVYVATSHLSDTKDRITGEPIPIADEMWFSFSAVNDPKVVQAEGDCNHALESRRQADSR
jgi:hypothetical protein